jgi:predicted NACHT family NTPase
MEPSSIAGPAVSAALAVIKAKLTNSVNRKAKDPSAVYASLEECLVGVLRWSGRIQFFGMTEAVSTEVGTIRLNITSQPRRFRSSGSLYEERSEQELLADDEHYLLLGAPGSGKTTTIKRLARQVVLNEPVSECDIYRYSVVIRLRELPTKKSLIAGLSDIFGTPRYSPDEDALHKSEEQRLFDYITKCLNESNTALFVDGLDELAVDHRSMIEIDLEALAQVMVSSKLIVTTRSGEYQSHLDGFNVVELCPLTLEQVRLVASTWLNNSDQFLTELSTLPHADIVDRPLLLMQLITLFQRDGALPEQPSTIYRRLMRLLLEDWDRERGIHRISQYARFDPERKGEFLAAIAYHLTYRIQTRVFREVDLVTSYAVVARRFGLPRQEAVQVAREIESHTGIIVSVADDFEFSHLSFQEFLCATHLVREPFPEHLSGYLAEYPEPLAIAVAIAANPANWLAGLVLKPANFEALKAGPFGRFLMRLAIERPFFGVSRVLGLAVLKLCEHAIHTKSVTAMHTLLSNSDIFESIAIALPLYRLDLNQVLDPDTAVLWKDAVFKNEFGFETPESGAVPIDILEAILQRANDAVLSSHGRVMPEDLQALRRSVAAN